VLSEENLIFAILVYGVPAAVGGFFFFLGWSRGMKRGMFSDERRSLLDAVGLCFGYVFGHYVLKGWDGIPPRLGENWLPVGVALSGVTILFRKQSEEPGGRFWVWISIVFLVTLGMMLGSLAYYWDVEWWTRFGILMALFAGALIFAFGVTLLASQFRAGDFFVFAFIMLGIAAVFFYATNSLTMAQLVLIPIAGAILAVFGALRRKDYRVSSAYAFVVAMIFACLLSYNHFGAAVSPPVATLILWMLAPAGALTALLGPFAGKRQTVYQALVYCVMFAASIGALAVARHAFEPTGY
jgi:hypothetical protein